MKCLAHRPHLIFAESPRCPGGSPSHFPNSSNKRGRGEILYFLVLSPLVLFLSGCLIQTRSDIEESEYKRSMQEQIAALQQNQAESSTQISETREALHNMEGKLDNLQANLVQIRNIQEGDRNGLLQKLEEEKHAREALQTNLEEAQKKLGGLSEDVEKLRRQVNSPSQPPISSSSSKKKDGHPAQPLAGDEFFEKKDWKNAILAYQEFREKNTKSPHIPMVTYKIGVSFQELGMKEDAKTFYEEVVSRYANTPAAKKSKLRLKSLVR